MYCSETYGIFDKQFHLREIKGPFIQSLMLVVDGMMTTDHKTLGFIEFLELLVRISFQKYELHARYSVDIEQVVEATQILLTEHLH